MATDGVCAAAMADKPEHFKVNPLYLEEGSSRDRAYSIARDERGYLWLGTDNGLKRYDGYGFTVFNNDPDDPKSLPFNTVGSLFIDSEGTLWAATRALSAFDPVQQQFDNYSITGEGSIWGIAEDARGRLWVGGNNFGLVGFDRQSRQVIHRVQGGDGRQGPRTITEIVTDVRNPHILWMSARQGLFRFDTRSHDLELVYASRQLGGQSRQTMSDVIMDSRGNLWVTTDYGLVVVDADTRQVRHYQREPGNPHSLSINIVRDVYEDSQGRIWIGTDKHGVHIYRPKTDDFAHIPASGTGSWVFPPGGINDIYEDRYGSIWFCLDSFGVVRINDRLQKFVTIDAGTSPRKLSFNSLLDLMEDRHGNIWIATDGGGLNRYDPESNTVTKYFHDPDDPSSLSSNSVLSVEEDDKGMIWAGTWAAGLNRLNPETGEVTHYRYKAGVPLDRSLAGNSIFRIVRDKGGWLWLSVWEMGLQRFHPETGRFVPYSYYDENDRSGLNDGSVNAIETSSRGYKWIGGYEGLQIYHSATETFSPVPLGESHNEIFDLYEDAQGILWIATSNGMIRYNHASGALKRYSVADGLADPFVVSIEQDTGGRLWLGTRGGLSRFDPKSGTFKSFDRLDGLAGTQFNRYSHLQTRDGTMYFGGAKGLTIFDPNKLPHNTHVPTVVVTGIELFQKPVEPGESPYLPRQISRMDKLELPYSHRDITFEFSSLSFISPTKNRYRYRLKGLEEKWTEVDSSRRRARYTNLDPGHYTFQVRGSNNDGVWNRRGANIDLTIITPWWMSWWARSSAVSAIVYLIYAFIQWRLRLNRRRERELSVEIEERRAAEEKLFHIAYHDALTDLPNRLWLLERLEELIERTAPANSNPFALLFLDGDRFKQINDTHGHQLGDHILQSAARRLERLLPSHYHAIRLGGDEFTVLVDEFDTEDNVLQVSQTIIDAFNRPFEVEKNLMFFKVSIGLVFCERQYKYPGQILRDADIAMYKAKELGRGVCQVFDAKMREQTLELTELEADLYKALERGELYLVYQPIIDLHTGELVGFEALCRWNHPEKGAIPPDKFIPIAEESGLIFTLGAWVLRQACSQLAAWIKEYDLVDPPTMSINLSSLELSHTYYLDQLDGTLAETGIEGRLLKLEITESTLMENTDSMNLLLDELRARDIELAIDDFGTGYSSLSYLDQLPVQVLKIDRRFVDAIGEIDNENSGSVEIVKATISLAHSLNVMVVAEGIETLRQYRLLQSYGCDFGQGYYIAKPLCSEDAIRFMHHEPMPEAEVRIAANDIAAHRIGPKKLRSRRRFRDK